MSPENRPYRVGLLVLAAMLAFGAGVFLIGEQNNLFRRMNHYTVGFASVAGLQAGNPVQLNGVGVGRVEKIVLPRDPGQDLLTVHIAVDRRYARRVRLDSVARIKTLGLLGDKYVDLTSGTEEAVVIIDGGEIKAAPATDVDQLIAFGENVVDNIVRISVSLRTILERMEHGEGLLGQLVADPEDGTDQLDLAATLRSTVAALNKITTAIEDGRSPVARLLVDEQLGDQVAGTIGKLESLVERAESGDGLVPQLLGNEQWSARVDTTLTRLEEASTNLAQVTQNFEDGEGLLPRLLYDEAYADRVTTELEELLNRLNGVSEQISEGDGTVSRLIQDPQVYDALQDVIVGVNESKLLRWLIRNRQKAGIKTRYREEQTQQQNTSADPSSERDDGDS